MKVFTQRRRFIKYKIYLRTKGIKRIIIELINFKIILFSVGGGRATTFDIMREGVPSAFFIFLSSQYQPLWGDFLVFRIFIPYSKS